MTETAFLDATSLLEGMANGSWSARDLVQLYADRIVAHNPALNAIVQLDVEAALSEADKCDVERKAGTLRGLLHGLPMTIKDAYATKGMITTGGAPDFKDYVPPEDAVAVGRLRDAGAIVMGKTNVPFMSGDLQSYNDVYGTTNNPWNLERTPGGSSGGAAAALAAGLTGLELGSDIGGSIRTPSSHCGLFGHKPSYGFVPLRGHIPGPPGLLAAADLSVGGPLARSARDLKLAFDVLAGGDPVLEPGWKLDLAPPRGTALSDYRVALWLTDPYCQPSKDVMSVLNAAVEKLVAAGANVDASPNLPVSLEENHNAYLPLLNAVIMQALPPETLYSFDRMMEDVDPSDMSREAQTVRGASMRHRDWLVLNDRRYQLMNRWAGFFQTYDIVLCPQIMTTAIKHDHRPFEERTVTIDGEDRPYMDQLKWAGPALLSQLPATMVPAGMAADGLPVGLQVIGPRAEDYTSLYFAELAEKVLGGFRIPQRFSGFHYDKAALLTH